MLLSAAVTFQDAVPHPVPFQIGFQQYGSGSVAENYAGAPVAIIYNGTHFIGSHYYNFFVSSAFNQGGAGSQAIQKSTAGSQQVKAPGIHGSDFFANQVGSRREEHVRSYRPYNNTVNF